MIWLRRLSLLSLLLISAAPAPDPLILRIADEAAAATPASLAFDRTARAMRSGGGTSTMTTITDRWDGRRWTLITTNGRPPTATERSEHRRQAGALPIPGYHALAAVVAAATGRRTDTDGRTFLVIAIMPPGSVHTDTDDISAHLQGEVRLAEHGKQVFVDQLKVTAREGFKIKMLIKVTGFQQTSEYAVTDTDPPRLTSQVSTSTGTMFGFPGGETATTTFVYR